MSEQAIPYGEWVPVKETPDDRSDYELADRAVEKVADAGGDLCIALRNIGATPWLRPTPTLGIGEAPRGCQRAPGRR